MTGELSKLPGIGRRTALRLAIHILRMERDSVAEMTESIDRFRNEIRYCSQCNNLSDEEICPICADRERDHTTVCVVEQVADVLSIENTRQYRGLYHVLGGVISPMQGIAPSDLKIDLLIERIAQGTIREVILAISTSVEGETTLFYLLNRLRQYPQVVPIYGIQRMSELNQWLSLENDPPQWNEEMQRLAVEEKAALGGDFCRSCGYCMPCPMGIEIPNAARMSLLMTRAPYQPYITKEWQAKMHKIESCINCRRCVAHCPYSLDTPRLLRDQLHWYENFCQQHQSELG